MGFTIVGLGLPMQREKNIATKITVDFVTKDFGNHLFEISFICNI